MAMHLEVFCRSMHPLKTTGRPSEDNEAFTIVSTMKKLRRLEIAYNTITDKGVLKILSSCPHLESLDMRGCWGVKLDNMSLKYNFPKNMVLGPKELGYYEMLDDCSYILESSN